MSNIAITTEAQFQEKMKERMRTLMGEMIPDTMLVDIIKKGIEEAFFKVVVVSQGYHNNNTVQYPWAVTFVKAEMEKQVNVALQKWIGENSGIFETVVKDMLGKGLLGAVIGAVQNLTTPYMNTLQQSLYDLTNELRNKNLIRG